MPKSTISKKITLSALAFMLVFSMIISNVYIAFGNQEGSLSAFESVTEEINAGIIEKDDREETIEAEGDDSGEAETNESAGTNDSESGEASGNVDGGGEAASDGSAVHDDNEDENKQGEGTSTSAADGEGGQDISADNENADEAYGADGESKDDDVAPDFDDSFAMGNEELLEVEQIPVILENQTIFASIYTDGSLAELNNDGTVITLSGEMPADAYAMAYPVEIVQEGEEDVLAAYDITLYDGDGHVYELTGAITVNIQPAGLAELLEGVDIENAQIKLLYIPDGYGIETAAVMENAEVLVTEQVITFEVEHFSTYVVTITHTWNGLILSYMEDGMQKQFEATIVDWYNYEASILAIKGSKLEFTGGESTTVKDGKVIDELKGNTTHIVKFTRVNSAITYNLALNITAIDKPEVSIVDSITRNGLLTAEIGGVAESTAVTYKWEKSSNVNGTYQEVTSFTANEKSINVAIDRGARMYYRVTTTYLDDNGAEQMLISEPFFVKYFMSLQNKSFEEPRYTSYMNYISNKDALDVGFGWQTTGVGTGNKKGQDIEVVNVATPANKKSFATNYLKNSKLDANAPDGVQFAEINCESYGALYQDVMVVPGSTINWQLAHRGRRGNDEMAVVIMPTRDVEGVTITEKAHYKKVEQHTQIAYSGQTSVGTIIRDGNTGWNYYHGNGYLVPDDVHVVRFFFVAVSTSSGSVSMGNFVDDIIFSSDLAYIIKYYVDGKEAGHETGTAVDGGTVHASKTGDYSDYALESVMLDGENHGKSTSFNPAMNGSVLEIYYVSKSVTVSKTVEGVSAEELAGYEAEFELYKGNVSGIPLATANAVFDGSSTETAIVFKNGDTVINLENSTTYFIKEKNHSDITGYSFEGASWGTSAENMESGEIAAFTTGSTSNVYKISFINTYTKEPVEADVTIMKVDDKGKPLKGAVFRLYYLDAEAVRPEDRWIVFGEDIHKTYSSDYEGVAKVCLSPGDTVYALEEVTAPLGYVKQEEWVYFVVNSEGKINITDDNGNVLINNKNEPLSITVNEDGVIKIPNAKEVYMLPSTGGSGTIVFRIAGAVVLVLLGIAAALYRSKMKGRFE